MKRIHQMKRLKFVARHLLISITLSLKKMMEVQKSLLEHGMSVTGRYIENPRDEVFKATHKSQVKEPKKMFQTNLNPFFTKKKKD